MKRRHYSACIGKKKRSWKLYNLWNSFRHTAFFKRKDLWHNLKVRGDLGFDISPDFLPRRPILSDFTRWWGHSDKRSPQMKLVMVHMCQMNHAAQTGPRWISFHIIQTQCFCLFYWGGEQTKKSGHAPAISGRNLKGSAKNELVKIVWTLPSRQTIQNTAADIKRKKTLNQSKGRAFLCDLTQPAVQIHVPHFYS